MEKHDMSSRKFYEKAALAVAGVLLAVAGLKLWAHNQPWSAGEDMLKCAENQKFLYWSIQAYVEEHGKVPPADFEFDGWQARKTWKCPSCDRHYNLHPENFGNARMVVITDQENKHPTRFNWWLRGLKPQVQTMGDGTIQVFEDGKVTTMNGNRNRG